MWDVHKSAVQLFCLPPVLYTVLCLYTFQALQRKMEVQSGVQQPEPRPLDSPGSGAAQQNQMNDRQMDASGRTSSDDGSKDAHPSTQRDDKKVSCRLPLVHICRRLAVCVGVSTRVCVCWVMRSCLLSYSGWYILHIPSDSFSMRALGVLKKRSCVEICMFCGVEWCQAFCVWAIQRWKDLFA